MSFKGLKSSSAVELKVKRLSSEREILTKTFLEWKDERLTDRELLFGTTPLR